MSGALTDVAQLCGLFDVSSHFYHKLLLQYAVCLTVVICVCVLNMVRVCGCSVEEVKRALLPCVHQPPRLTEQKSSHAANREDLYHTVIGHLLLLLYLLM